MNDVLNIGMRDILKGDFLRSFRDEIVIVNISGERFDHSHFENREKIRLNAFSVILMLNGTMAININGTDYCFKSKAILDILDLHVFKNLDISPDFEGYNLIISKDFMNEVMRGVKMLSVSDFISRCNDPVEQITDEEADLLKEVIIRILKNMEIENHCHKREMIKNELRSFIMEISNIVTNKNHIPQRKVLHDKEEIIVQFIHLLTIHCKEQHSVHFYANELCLDPKYLSRILKSFNGETAGTWIDRAVIKEAKAYLGDRNFTIQQIADILNFSDQSAFGKFFKKHCGTSPLNYRIEMENY